jgi:DNA helicase-2/ATP-dependent DNA helicase PcrA
MDFNELNDMQQKAVMHFKGPLLILAGAGSGKTRVITNRIAYLISEKNVKPWHIMALTFTNKAAGEMRSRVRDQVGDAADDILVSTFHSACVRFLRRYADRIGFTRHFTIYDSDDSKSVMKSVIKKMGLDPKKYRGKDFLGPISNAKNELMTVDDFKTHYAHDYKMKLAAEAYRLYQEELKEADAMDFDDLLVKTVELFENNPDVLKTLQDRYRFISVDEYQDTNTAQFRIVKLLADHVNIDGGHEHNLCVVGDDDQSIYAFRGADIRNILEFEKYYPDCEVIKLEENYRSTKNILDAANAVIRNNNYRKDKKLWTEGNKGDQIYYRSYNSDSEEAYAVVSSIVNGVRSSKASYKDFAVLYRTNSQSRAFEEMLIRESVPYKIVGGINFYSRREIKDLLCYLRVIENSNDTVSLLRIINVPKRKIGPATVQKLSDHAAASGISLYEAIRTCESVPGVKSAASKLREFSDMIEHFKNLKSRVTVQELLDAVIDQTGYDIYITEEDRTKAEDRMQNIDEFKRKALEFDVSGPGSGRDPGSDRDPGSGRDPDSDRLEAFLEEVSLVADIDSVNDSDDLVLLMTLHAAKGLEFPYVFMAGMEDNLFPSSMTLDIDDEGEREKAIEEERRLCYVGITRARKKLAMSSAKMRFRNGEQQFNRHSMFLDEIPRHLINYTKGDLMPFGNAVSGRSSIDPVRRPDLNRRSSDLGLKENTLRPAFGIDASSLLLNKIKKGRSGVSQASGLKTGDRVRHDKFGEGTVKDVSPKGNDQILTILFDNAGQRKFVASFVKLEKL